MNTYKIDGWTVNTILIDINTGKEIEWTDEIRRKIIERMYKAAGYRVIWPEDKDGTSTKHEE